jgi:oligopeptide transport system substrate-binding protein
MVLDDMAVIPKWSATTPFAWSENVTDVKLTPFGTIDLSSVTKK